MTSKMNQNSFSEHCPAPHSESDSEKESIKKETLETLGDSLEQNVDSFREMIVGEDVRELYTRLNQMEGHIAEEVAKLHSELQKNIDALTSYTRREVASLNDRFSRENTEHLSSHENVISELRRTFQDFWKRVSEIDERAVKSWRDLHERIELHSKGLSEELRESREALLSQMNSTEGDLEARKLDKASLGEYFVEFGERLGGTRRGPALKSAHFRKSA